MLSQSKKILIIEDNVIFLKMVARKLQSEGYTPMASQDGLLGLDLARKVKPDLIILDLMLPSMDGHKICRMLKFDRQLKNIPVIILTSRDTEADAALAKSSRADAYLLKTVQPAVLLHAIRTLLKKAEQFETERIVFHGEALEIQKCKSHTAEVAAV